MRSAAFIALAVLLVVASPAAAAARTVVQSNTAADPRLAGTSLVWREGSTIIRRRPGGRVTRRVLPPGPTSIIDASATHVLVDRTTQECPPAPEVGSCRLDIARWAGPLDGPLAPLAPGRRCPDASFGGSAALGGSTAVLPEVHRCAPPGHRYAVVRVDLDTGGRQTLARQENPATQIRVAGDWIAWSHVAGFRDEIVLWRDGAVRRRIDELELSADSIRAWDLQADGTLVVAIRAPDGPGQWLFAVRPGARVERPFATRRSVWPDLHLADDRVATFTTRGRLRIIDLTGRSREMPRARDVQSPLAGFDGRRGLWIRTKVLDSGTFCPFGAPEPCEPRPSIERHWIVADRIAR